jgi:hypothetical protein
VVFAIGAMVSGKDFYSGTIFFRGFLYLGFVVTPSKDLTTCGVKRYKKLLFHPITPFILIRGYLSGSQQ